MTLWKSVMRNVETLLWKIKIILLYYLTMADKQKNPEHWIYDYLRSVPDPHQHDRRTEVLRLQLKRQR